MNLPKPQDLELSGKKVLVRADLDVNTKILKNQEFGQRSFFRLYALLPTLKYLAEKNCEVVLLGHRGRPGGEEEGELSLKPVSEVFEKILTKEWGKEMVKNLKMQMMENLRLNKAEEKNERNYAGRLAEHGEFLINEAFAASHRNHASIVSLPEFLPSVAGFRFQQEVNMLNAVLANSRQPVVSIISGVKQDKIKYAQEFKKFSDKILIGGRLPEQIYDSSPLNQDENYIIAGLLSDKEDITPNSIESFEKEIKTAGTIILSGPIGRFEDEGHRTGTERVFKAVAESSAYKVAGGGETHEAITMFNLADKFDWISVGGGAMLEFLSRGTLPGIEALVG